MNTAGTCDRHQMRVERRDDGTWIHAADSHTPGTECDSLTIKPDPTDEEVKAQHNDLEMMRRPHLWPHGGKLLPLKRHGLEEQALLISMGDGATPNGGMKPTYMVILDMTIVEVALAIDNGTAAETLARSKDSPMFGQDNLLRTLVDAGWVVD